MAALKAAPANPLLPDLTRVKLEGYVFPTFMVLSSSESVPRDRLVVGMVSSRSGMRLSGNPYDQWSYVLHVGFDAAIVNNRVGAAQKVVVGAVPDRPGLEAYTFITAVPIEDATVTYAPADWYKVTAGHQRIPFSVGAGVTITAQMFPTRPGPANVFMTGPDDGLVNTFSLLKERIQAHLGVFNGSSLGMAFGPGTTTVGPTWSGFLDVHPLGKMPPREGDEIRGPFRIGMGVGVLYRVGTLFDQVGYEATRFQDARLSTAIRAAFYGLYIQAEYLRRLQTDDLSSRPSSATGAYAQASYYAKIVDSIALGPLARFGVSVQDEAFAPQKRTSFEAGIAFYPRADLPKPDVLRLLVQYLHEAHDPSGDTANGMVMHMRMQW